MMRDAINAERTEVVAMMTNDARAASYDVSYSVSIRTGLLTMRSNVRDADYGYRNWELAEIY